MQYGYKCEDCEAAVFPVTSRSELQWLKARMHVVREVAKHSVGGLDLWMTEGFAFLDEHEGHTVITIARR